MINAELAGFTGQLDVEDFLDWMVEVEKYFDLMDVPEHLQVMCLLSYIEEHLLGENNIKVTEYVKTNNQCVVGDEGKIKGNEDSYRQTTSKYCI